MLRDMTDEKRRFPYFRTAILNWFSENLRPLPWRKDYSPYRTWVAEIMLQQTQMERGVAYFLRWMERFPDIAAVAAADEDALLSAWEGLGYYRRVRNIKAAAQVIMNQYAGAFPDTFEAILALPGIGPYTAGAIASTAFNLPVPCVDGNVERVFARVFDIKTPVRAEPARSYLRELAAALIPEGKARDFNQAVMELGALVCGRVPRCADCPVKAVCTSFSLGITDKRPVAAPRKALTAVTAVNGVLTNDAGRVLLRRRGEGGLWAGLWEFPGGQTVRGEKPDEALRRIWHDEMHVNVTPGAEIAVIKHNYTTFKVTLRAFRLSAQNLPKAGEDLAWLTRDELASCPMPAPHRALVSRL